jgi:DNA-binding MarR family transcriptional regulator
MSDPPSVSRAEYQALAEFRHALRQFLRFSEEAARSVGLAPQQHQALLAIKGFPGREEVTISELADRLQILHHSVVGLVNRLENKGLIERRHGGADKRAVHVSVAPRGVALLEQLSTTHRAEIAILGRHLATLMGAAGIEASERIDHPSPPAKER